MANLQKFRSHESDNTQSAAVWSQQTEVAVDATTDTVDVSAYHTVHLQTDEDIYFGFSTYTTDMIDSDDSSSSDTIVANNDPTIPANTLTFLKVPKGVGDTIYVHFKQVSSAASKFLKIVHL